MRTVPVVIADELGQGRRQVLLVEHDRVVQALAAKRANHPFHDRIRTRRPDRCGNALGCGAGLEVVADSQQDDVTREAMASYQARRLTGRVPATGTAGTNSTAALVVAIMGQV
jgi:hypothetical protein